MFRSDFYSTRQQYFSFLGFLVALAALLFPTKCVAETEIESTAIHSPERIVVFPLFAEEILLEMIGPDRIVFVGHTYFDNGQSYSPSMMQTKHIPGNHWTNCNEWDFLALEPDLVILPADLQESYEHGLLFPNLKQAQIPCMFLGTPMLYCEIKDCILELGNIVGKPQRAMDMVENMDTELQHIKEKLAAINIKQEIRVMYYNAQQANFFEVAKLCNMYSPYGAEDTFIAIDDAFVAEWNPDVIFYNPVWVDTDGTLLGVDSSYADAIHTMLLQNPDLQNVTAVKENRIYALNLHSSQYICESVWNVLLAVSSDCIK